MVKNWAQMLQVGDIDIGAPVLLAPMAGITDRPYRELVAGFGAGLVVSEMVASQEVLAGNRDALARAEVAAGAVGTSVQIMGRDPVLMAEAARLVVGEGAEIVDINMGCPARKVTSGAGGSALMREPGLALEIIQSVVGAIEVPVTLKMRLGWDANSLNAAELAFRAEQLGIRMITVHGRTRCQFYNGPADWKAIKPVVDAVDIPVIANGDIVDGPSAAKALSLSGAAGVMVGRGAIGRPWILAEIAAALEGRNLKMRPIGANFGELVGRHARAHMAFHGERTGVRAMRKHLDAYIGQVPNARDLRDRLIRETDPNELFRGFQELGRRDAEVAQWAA